MLGGIGKYTGGNGGYYDGGAGHGAGFTFYLLLPFACLPAVWRVGGQKHYSARRAANETGEMPPPAVLYNSTCLSAIVHLGQVHASSCRFCTASYNSIFVQIRTSFSYSVQHVHLLYSVKRQQLIFISCHACHAVQRDRTSSIVSFVHVFFYILHLFKYRHVHASTSFAIFSSCYHLWYIFKYIYLCTYPSIFNMQFSRCKSCDLYPHC